MKIPIWHYAEPLKVPVIDVSYEQRGCRWMMRNTLFCKEQLALILMLLHHQIKKKKAFAHHNGKETARLENRAVWLIGWNNSSHTKLQQEAPCFSVLHFVCHFNSFISHTNLHHSNSHQCPKSIILAPAQSELTPRPFSNCPGMFGGAQSNWTVTITNGWFAAARHCNVALNEWKHAHQFHTVANTILLWVIVVGHFSFKVLSSRGNLPWLCVCVDFLEWGIINLLHSGRAKEPAH